jgi:hypothetical protein
MGYIIIIISDGKSEISLRNGNDCRTKPGAADARSRYSFCGTTFEVDV